MWRIVRERPGRRPRSRSPAWLRVVRGANGLFWTASVRLRRMRLATAAEVSGRGLSKLGRSLLRLWGFG
jgi:uncharacterized membrane protein